MIIFDNFSEVEKKGKIAKDLLAKFFTHAWFSHIIQFSYMDAGKILLGHQA